MTSEDDYQKMVLKELNYNSYLKVPELLDLQEPRSRPAHHDEMFFIIIHQTAELWFKEMLHETSKLREALRRPSISRALKLLRRIHGIMDLQVKQINLLNTLTPVEFAGFREMLRPASGFQSFQFRELEFTYGLRNSFFLKFFDKFPDIAARLDKVMDQPSIYDEVIHALAAEKYPVPKDLLERDVREPWKQHHGLVETIREIYLNPEDNYHWVLLFEVMLDFDERLANWRHVHNLMVCRTIGSQVGTGGSEGFDFLQSRAGLRCFPELWEVRNYLGQ